MLRHWLSRTRGSVLLAALLFAGCGAQPQALSDAPLPTPTLAVQIVRLEDYGAVSCDKGERTAGAYLLFTCYTVGGERQIISLYMDYGLVVIRPETALLVP